MVLKVAFLVGGDSPSTRLCIERVCALEGVQPVAILRDTARPSLRQRRRNLLRNLRANGWRYIPHRILGTLARWAEQATWTAVVAPGRVRQVLQAAFPERLDSLESIGAKFGIPVYAAGNLNGPEAAALLQKVQADLGIVLGTRVLRESIFSVPRLGCVNLHKGKVPEYRGMPPGFWELYEDAPTAGVTVHFVDKGLDTGDVIAASEFPILATDTPVSLLERLHQAGASALEQAVAAIQRSEAGQAPLPRSPQPPGGHAPKSLPTLRQIAELRAKRPHWKQEAPLYSLAKYLYCLAMFYSGAYTLVRWLHGRDRARAAILLYHRVNDYSKDPLTVDTATFAAQLLAVSRYYSFCSTTDLVEAIRQRRPLQQTAVAIHFDDCYQDVFTHGAPVLQAVGSSATAFISTGFLDTQRTFEHDRKKYPFQFPMLRSAELQDWARRGFEVGAHTVNHVDLGACPAESIRAEIVDCGQHLQRLLDRQVPLFSFPFGRIQNIRGEAVGMIRETYGALFSAHGGFIGRETDLYDIPRMGVSYEASPLYLLLQLEGLAPNQLAETFGLRR